MIYGDEAVQPRRLISGTRSVSCGLSCLVLRGCAIQSGDVTAGVPDGLWPVPQALDDKPVGTVFFSDVVKLALCGRPTIERPVPLA